MSSPNTWFNGPISWLDERGKGAWIAAMVLGFVFVWPLGLAILFYMLWSKRMCHSFFKTKNTPTRAIGSSGNNAFDAYKDETITRLNEEQSAFSGFLQRLRDAKDKTEFDDFMDERVKAKKEASA